MASSSPEAGVAGTMSRRRFLLAGSLICVPSLGWAATPASGWRMWIDQDGARIEITPTVRLKRQPFTLVFQGPRKWAYTVLACEDQADIAGKDPLAVLDASVNIFKIFAEYADPAENIYICVNGTGSIAADMNGVHYWSDEPDEDQHDFTRFTADGTGHARAERDVRSLLLITAADDRQETPIESTTLATISLIVAAVKPTDIPAHELDYIDPLSFTIVFA